MIGHAGVGVCARVPTQSTRAHTTAVLYLGMARLGLQLSLRSGCFGSSLLQRRRVACEVGRTFGPSAHARACVAS
eukprot:9284609-Alexandrium_andersonii.AAC.1